VISDKMAKTIVVRVQRRFPHPKFKKVVTAYKKFYAHDEKREAKLGDRVRIEETRPLPRPRTGGWWKSSGAPAMCSAWPPKTGFLCYRFVLTSM